MEGCSVQYCKYATRITHGLGRNWLIPSHPQLKLILFFKINSTAKPGTKPSPSKRRCSGNEDVTKREVASSENRIVINSSTNHVSTEMSPASQFPAQSIEREEKDCKNESSVGSVKSRMQKLAEQRRYWDGGMCLTLHDVVLKIVCKL